MKERMLKMWRDEMIERGRCKAGKSRKRYQKDTKETKILNRQQFAKEEN